MTAPLASMTGFARSDGEAGGMAWAWELRSVNGRGLDLKIRLPSGLDAMEPALRELAGKSLRRGNVTANCTVRRESGTRFAVDPAALAQVLALAQELATRIPGAAPPSVDGLLSLPGVLRAGAVTEDDALDEAARAAVRDGFAAALAQLVLARRAEGGRTALLLATLLDEVTALHTQATELAADQPAAHQARLHEQISLLLRDLPSQHERLGEDRLAQEVALLATRSDVREELDRLSSHIAAAHALLDEGEAVGRRFDFLVQEFVREINTLCAKSSTIPLTTIGLRLKAAIEQLREQIQNVE